MSEPFLKWPGGKRWLAHRVRSIIRPQLIRRYFEPFLGGGAVFFSLGAQAATLSDVNADLINTYRQVRDQCDAVLEKLQALEVSQLAYYSMRSLEPIDPLERAIRFLYLNRTAFGGMYRVNREGRFNVPYGGGQRTPQRLWKSELLRTASAALQDVDLIHSDFEPVLENAGAGDVVYCDPTYTVAHENNGFVRYNERNFSWNDQVRLAAASRRAADRGAVVILSNAYHTSVHTLYPTALAEKISRRSLVSPTVSARREVHEYLLVLRP